jgi:predicted nucleic acid-binding protein
MTAMYLLDTNIVSELFRQSPSRAVLSWIGKANVQGLFLSAVTLGELQLGVEKRRDTDPARAAAIESWIDALASTQQILSLDAPTFRIWGRLMHRQPLQLSVDVMIAATALAHDLIVATRNTRDFERLGVSVFNPFSST